MKFMVVGAGGVGGYYAARLKSSGNNVQVVARGKHLESIRRSGIHLKSDVGTVNVTVNRVSDKPEDLEVPDVILLAVKAFQVGDALESIRPVVGRNTRIITIQNGVDAYRRAADAYPGNALGGLTRVIGYMESPGTIRHIGSEGVLVFGPLHGEVEPAMEGIAETFRGAGIQCSVSGNISKDIWEKFMIMATMGGIGSITGAPMGALRQIPETRSLIDQSLDEIMGVANRLDIPIDGESRKKAWDFLESLPYDATSSTQRDIAAGKRSEMEYLSGTVSSLGKETGFSTPLHDFIYRSLLPAELRARGEITY